MRAVPHGGFVDTLWLQCGHWDPWTCSLSLPLSLSLSLSLSLCVMAPVIIFRSLGLLECRHCLLQLSFENAALRARPSHQPQRCTSGPLASDGCGLCLSISLSLYFWPCFLIPQKHGSIVACQVPAKTEVPTPTMPFLRDLW